MLVGALVPIQGLISFDTLLLVCAPNVAMAAIHNGWRYHAGRRPLDRVLLWPWSWLGLTIGAYYLYLASGLTQRLWLRGLWWSENDVLHAGLLVWIGYVVFFVAARLEDEPGAGDAPPVGSAQGLSRSRTRPPSVNARRSPWRASVLLRR